MPATQVVQATSSGTFIFPTPDAGIDGLSLGQSETQVTISFTSTGTGLKEWAKKARGLFASGNTPQAGNQRSEEEVVNERSRVLRGNEMLQRTYALAASYLRRSGIDDLILETTAIKLPNGHIAAFAKFLSGGRRTVLAEQYFTGETGHTISEIADHIALDMLSQKIGATNTNDYFLWARTRVPLGIDISAVNRESTALPPLDLTTVDTVQDACAAIRRYWESAADGYILSFLDKCFGGLATSRDEMLSDTFHALAPHIREMKTILANVDANKSHKEHILSEKGPFFLDELRAVVEEARRRGVFSLEAPAAKKLQALHETLKGFYETVVTEKGLPCPPAFERIDSAIERSQKYHEKAAPIYAALPKIVAKLEAENSTAQASGFETAYDYFLKTNYDLDYYELRAAAERFCSESEQDVDDFILGLRDHTGNRGKINLWDIEFAMNRWIMAEAGVSREPTVTLKSAIGLVQKIVNKKFGIDIYEPKYGIVFDLAVTDKHRSATNAAVSVSQSGFWKVATSNMDPNAVTLKNVSSILHEVAGHITQSILTQEHLKKIGSPDSVLGVLRNPTFSEVFSIMAQDFLNEMTIDLFKAGFPLKYLESHAKVTRLYEIFRQRRAAFWAISERILYDNKNFPTVEAKEAEMNRLQKKWLKTPPAAAYGYWLSEFYFWPHVGRYWLSFMTPIYAEKIKTLAAKNGSTVEAFLRPYLEAGGEAGMEIIR